MVTKKMFGKYLAVTLLTLQVLHFSEAFARGRSGGGYRGRSVRVHGFVKRNGSYVGSHMRSHPNGTRFDNWSTKGNVNPYTGAYGTKSSD